MPDLKMPYINEVRLAGRLTREPELRYVGNQTGVCDLNVACSRITKTDGGDKREETLFAQVTAWTKLAEWCAENLHKGSPVYVDGRLHLEQWTDRDGKKQSKTRIVANRVQALAWDGDGAKAEGAAINNSPNDDIPF